MYVNHDPLAVCLNIRSSKCFRLLVVFCICKACGFRESLGLSMRVLCLKFWLRIGSKLNFGKKSPVQQKIKCLLFPPMAVKRASNQELNLSFGFIPALIH